MSPTAPKDGVLLLSMQRGDHVWGLVVSVVALLQPGVEHADHIIEIVHVADGDESLTVAENIRGCVSDSAWPARFLHLRVRVAP